MRLEEAIRAVADMNSKNGVPQKTYIIEETAELIKEFMKEERKKGDKEAISKEAIDVLTTILVFFARENVPREYIHDQIMYKCARALERFNKNGEI